MRPPSLAIFVVASLVSFFIYYDIAFFSAVLPSHVTTIVAFLIVAQPFPAQVTPSSPGLLHRPTSVVFALAAVTHHVAHAAYNNVTAETIADTYYKDTPVSITGSDIVIDLNKNDSAKDVYFAFNGSFQFILEKCPTERAARVIIENHHCKWTVDWDDIGCSVRFDDRSTKWDNSFPVPMRGTIHSLMFRYDSPLERMECDDRTRDPPVTLDSMNVQDLCMWASSVQGKVSAINVTSLETNCPVKMTIMNATLYTFEPDVTTTQSTTANEEEDLPTWQIICIVVGGLLLVLLVVCAIFMSVFCARRRRRKAGKPQASKPTPVAPKPPPPSEPAVVLIEWEEVQAHLSYIDTTTESHGFKDKVSVAGSEVEVLEPVVGDYGNVKAQYSDRQRIHMYYSWIPDRLRKFEEIASLAHRAAKGTDRDVLVVNVEEKYFAHLPDGKQPLGEDPTKDEIKQHMRPHNVSFLITHELGPTLGVFLTQFEGERMSLHDAANYAYASFQALRSLHQSGIVHRDVSPWAFALEVYRPLNLLMTNLSLARQIYDIEKKAFVPRRRRVNFFGTVPLASRAAHKRQERSFKDDVESWFYTIYHLMSPGQTPWHNLQYDPTKEPAEKEKLHEEFAKLKEEFLRSFADTKNPRNAQAPGPIFASIAEQVLKSTFESQTEEFAPELAKKLEAFVKEVPEESEDKQRVHPLRKLPERPRCPTDKYLRDDLLPDEVLNARPGVLY